jgi:hypothetical protein
VLVGRLVFVGLVVSPGRSVKGVVQLSDWQKPSPQKAGPVPQRPLML